MAEDKKKDKEPKIDDDVDEEMFGLTIYEDRVFIELHRDGTEGELLKKIADVLDDLPNDK